MAVRVIEIDRSRKAAAARREGFDQIGARVSKRFAGRWAGPYFTTRAMMLIGFGGLGFAAFRSRGRVAATA
jgi:hypothetical protein